MNPLSIRISKNNQIFVNKLVQKGTSKTEAVNKALDIYRKLQLQHELTSLALDSIEEDSILAETGIEDYLTLLKDEN